MNSSMPSSKLVLKQLQLMVHLGVTAAERAKSQQVTLNITIKFPKVPLTDKLADTICYDKLTTAITEFCHNKEFNLIEYMAKQLYDFIKQQIPVKYKLQLSLTKIPPITNLDKSIFTISDWEE
jgi:dihydroneopterin aldolase